MSNLWEPPAGLLLSLQDCLSYRRLAERRDREPDNLRRLDLASAFSDFEKQCKANPLTWALLTDLSSNDLDELRRRIRPSYRVEVHSRGYRVRHYIRTGDRYARHSTGYTGDPGEDWKRPYVVIKPIRAILKRILP
jgi:hypothetical protein